MRVHTITTYFDGEHADAFHILAEDDYALLHALEVIKTSSEVQHFKVDFTDGFEFYELLFKQVYPGRNLVQSLSEKMKKEVE